MIDVRFQPMGEWPRKRTPSYRRKNGHFKVNYVRMLDDLEGELKKLSAKDIVIEAGFGYGDIRNDGWPYAGRRPGDPGVILGFKSKYGPLRLPCDYFNDYTHNLRAIGLHLERLRHASMYGVGEYGEQYKGWLRLGAGAPIEMGGETMTVEEAAKTVIQASGIPGANGEIHRVVQDLDFMRAAYRSAARTYHPDNGGDSGMWAKIQTARTVLDRHHGLVKNAGGA